MWLRFFRRLKSKILPVALACVCLVPCFCLTTFAADAPPAGYTEISPGEVVNPLHSSQYVFPAYEGVEYTIVGLGHFAGLWGVTESGQKVWLDVTFPDDVPLVYVADGTYPWIMLDSGVANTVPASVTWEPPSALAGVVNSALAFVTGMLAAGTSLVVWIMQTPLALLGVVLFLLVFFVVGIRKLISGT